jgi:hypothetical protein
MGNVKEISKPAKDDPKTFQLNSIACAKIEITEPRGELHENDH